ncbi:anti-sigma regulatory factor [Pedobacter sp. MC2016-14]|uniref:anti-sigma regulatory factor n=1 Tax=Pedobacter sp. MC2016-14 TaxID=2897327 RepID=UPI001E2D8E22|nr:anti-sigma regulatory factor [Pedobacter sp. MC2016-14]MCD0488175.1 anti-sigma regulatory factor [Pedobacter sp. MC2016-14]
MLIQKDQDVVPFRNRVKDCAVKIKMGLVNQTKLITAASELVRNMLKYGHGGEVFIEIVSEGRNSGVRLIFKDKGPGIQDVELAMKDGYSTGKSLGLGLPGTKRLVNVFELKSEVGVGTTVSIIKWCNG